MGEWTDQDEAREVDGRLAPPTTPDRDTIAEDRKALDAEHEAGRGPTPEEEEAAERSGPADPEVAEAYEDALERGAAQEGEGKPGV
jgi:hypothetical protein